MTDIYFIGGAARMGKTTAELELVKRRPMLAASADAIRRVAKSLVSPTANQYYAAEAAKYGYPVVEVNPADFQSAIQRAVTMLTH